MSPRRRPPPAARAAFRELTKGRSHAQVAKAQGKAAADRLQQAADDNAKRRRP